MKILFKPKYQQLQKYQYCIMTAVTCVSTEQSQKHCASDMHVLQSQWSKSVSTIHVCMHTISLEHCCDVTPVRAFVGRTNALGPTHFFIVEFFIENYSFYKSIRNAPRTNFRKEILKIFFCPIATSYHLSK